MAKNLPASTPTPRAALASEYLYAAFRWTKADTQETRFLGAVLDVVGGSNVLAEFLEWDERNAVNDQPVVLDPSSRGELQRLLAGSLGLLRDAVERELNRIDASEVSHG